MILRDAAATTSTEWRKEELCLTYNPAGQIVTNTRSNALYSWTGTPAGTVDSTVNGLNQLTDHNGAATAPAYDARGNLAAEGGRTFSYSSENLLTAMTGGGREFGWTYDPLMRLHRQTTSGLATRSYAMDGHNAIATVLGNGASFRLVYGPGEDEVLYQIDNQGRRTWFHADERGSVIAGSDHNGVLGSIKTYDEYGGTQSLAYQHGFAGTLTLGVSGLLYNRARIYDPTLGRFLQTDPIGYGDGMNMYAYVRGDPVNFTDPSGMKSHIDPLAPLTGYRDSCPPGWTCMSLSEASQFFDRPMLLLEPGGAGGGGAGSGSGPIAIPGPIATPRPAFLDRQTCGSGIDEWLGAAREVGEATSDLGSIGVIGGAVLTPFAPQAGIPIMRSAQAVNLLGEAVQAVANIGEIYQNGDYGPLASQLTSAATGAGALRAFEWYRRIPVRSADGRFARNPLTRFQEAYRRAARLVGSKAGGICMEGPR